MPKSKLKLASQTEAPLPYSTNPYGTGGAATDLDTENGLSALHRIINEGGDKAEQSLVDTTAAFHEKYLNESPEVAQQRAKKQVQLTSDAASFIGSIANAGKGVAKLFNPSVAAKVAKELPMDEATRMGRAKKMGFDTEKTYYHGSKADIPSFLLLIQAQHRTMPNYQTPVLRCVITRAN